MASHGRRKIILFLDSRGKNMEYMIKEMNKSGKPIEPWVFDGFTIEDLVAEAEYYA